MPLPTTNPRHNWTDQQFRDAIATAKEDVTKRAPGGTLGDPNSVYAGLVANYETAYPGHAPLPK